MNAAAVHHEIYIVGSGRVPKWCEHKLMMYQKLDGSIGLEFYGDWKNVELSDGDTLIKDGHKIRIRRKEQDESKRFSASD